MVFSGGRTQITPPEWKLDESAIAGPDHHQQQEEESPVVMSQSDQTSFGLLPQECLATHDGRAAGGQNTFWTTLPHMQQTTTTPQLASVSEVGTFYLIDIRTHIYSHYIGSLVT